jgi:DNA-binding SARP family transcriptional activator
MEFGVLGPLELRHDSHAVLVSAAKDRTLLAELLVHDGAMVGTAHLADALWGDSPPADPVNAVQVRVSRLRGLLRRAFGPQGAALLRTWPGGYALRAPERATDAARGAAPLAAAAGAPASGAVDAALATHDRAETLWRGEPYAGATDSSCVAAEAARLAELRDTAREDRAETALAAGRPAEAVAALTAPAGLHPLRERTHYLLITALHALGRTAEALAHYARLRDDLAAHLGTDPSPPLRELHLALLQADAAPTPGPQAPPAPAAPDDPPTGERAPDGGPDTGPGGGAGGGPGVEEPPRPAQLPPGPAFLAGRHAALAALRAALTPPGADGDAPDPLGPAPADSAAGDREDTDAREGSDAGDREDTDAREGSDAGAEVQAAIGAALVPAPAPGPRAGAGIEAAPGPVPVPAHVPATGAVISVREGGERGDGPVVVVVTGMGGAGKTALALRAAHRAAPHYPDGQVFVALRGATPGLSPVPPGEALEAVLRSLGGQPPPAGEDPAVAAAALRSLLAGRRVLLVLDDAHSAAQVRPLLPAGGGCAVLVTSRSPLASLDSAVRVTLGPLPADECVELLRGTAGADRVAADPAGAARLAELCGGLPLALRVVGGRLSARASWSLASVADRLAAQHARLDELDLDDLSVRGTLSVAYQELARAERPADRAAALAFRRLGLLDLPSYSPALLARLMDTGEGAAHAALDRLVDVALLDEHRLGRYAPHDLVRELARELARREDTGEERRAAARRAVGWYTGMFAAAARAYHQGQGRPQRRLSVLPPPDPALTGAPADPGRAAAWTEEERHNALALLRQAAREEDGGAWALPLGMGLASCLLPSGYYGDLLAAAALNTHAAHVLGDSRAEALARNDMAAAHWASGRPADALGHVRAALGLWRELGDVEAQLPDLNNLGLILALLGRADEAKATHEHCLELCARIGDRFQEAAALSHLGNLHDTIDPRQSIGYHERSAAIGRELGIPLIEVVALCNIGCAHLALDDPARALPSFRAALARGHEAADWQVERDIRVGLVRALRRLGRTSEARAECDALLALAHDRHDAYAQRLAEDETAELTG